MYYYSSLFGEKMQRIRKQIGLSRDTVAEQSGVNRDTLRRIEKGEVIPKFETLEILSPIYHTDLSQLLLECRTEDTEYLNDLMNRIERKIDDGVSLFEEEKEEMKAYAESSVAIYQKNLLRQWYFFLCALDELERDKSSERGVQLLTESLQQTLPDFQFENYDAFTYKEQEIRILMNFGYWKPFRENRVENEKLMKFCFEQLTPSSPLYLKVAFNLCVAHQRMKNYEEALQCAENAINIAHETRAFQGLSRLYYEKAYAEYHLDNPNFRESLKKALLICEMHGQFQLQKELNGYVKTIFHLDPKEL